MEGVIDDSENWGVWSNQYWNQVILTNVSFNCQCFVVKYVSTWIQSMSLGWGNLENIHEELQ